LLASTSMAKASPRVLNNRYLNRGNPIDSGTRFDVAWA